MAKIDINFNNNDYSIDESSLSAATAELQSHLSTVMNGSGATINLGGASYNIDSSKLQSATDILVSHLRTVSGNGYKVIVGGVEYNVDSTKMSKAVTDIEAVLGNLQSGGGESGGEDDYFPIEWNAMDVVGNPSADFYGLPLVKVSSVVLPLSVLEETTVTIMIDGETMSFDYFACQSIDGAVVAVYGENDDFHVVSVPAAGEYEGITFSEAGLYAPDFNAMRVSATIVIDKMLPQLPQTH